LNLTGRPMAVACIQPYDLVMGVLFIFRVLGLLRAAAKEYREDD
jgi:hypothetical protein